MLDADHVKELGIAVLSLLALTSCVPSDPHPPWDTDEMVRQLASDLRRFEGLSAELSDCEILAWRIDTAPRPASMPPIPVPGGSGFVPPGVQRVEIVLLWGRTGPESAPTGWALVQGYRHPGSGAPWQRTLINRELAVPLTRLRRGEEADGTWHGYHRYDRPPTSRDGCEFAAVDFLVGDPAWHRTAGAFRNRAWARAFGEAPACRFPEGTRQ